ncbi:MAG: FumA C-terminus/TtdB family hydratase beta subunit, partial [Candidatus Pacearchaeota archaeon]|nr:FumA C-terminus/TtdB family hydratase beta subunit [Candidatus Pacearchaeota archaeon]
HAGDRVLLNGTIYTARDAAHKRLISLIEKGQPIPIELHGAIIYYVGPTPAPPGKAIGSAGPTTAVRMDSYAIKLLEHVGVKGMIGKGERSQEFRDACKLYKSIYFAASGGIAALLSKHVKSSKIILYEDLGTEAIRRLDVMDFPVIVANDIYGRDYYESGRKKYSKSIKEILS